jgi:hypothetical protein
MTRLGSAFKNSDGLRLKTFELGGQIFRVRIPLTKEMEAIEERIKKVDEAEEQRRYEKMVAGFSEVEIDGVVKTENDLVVDGRSTRDMVRMVLQMENRVVEFIKLLVPVDGTLDDITYEEIDSEWPMSVQLDLLAKINEVIAPGYKEERKN